MTDRASGRPTVRTDLAVWLALLVAFLGLLQAGTPPRTTVLALIVVAFALALSLRWRIGPAVVVLLLVIGVALRFEPSSGFSDVLTVTQAAGREMLAGGNPYGHGYEESFPPGAPFAYGPAALLWYLPSLDEPRRIELLASLLVLGALAVRGRPLGLAVFAVTPVLIVAATDGSNDTSAGVLILLALLVGMRVPVAGALLLAVATAFKPYALAWLPGLIAYAGAIAPLLAFLAASVLLWLPAIIAWGPDQLLWSFRKADALHGQAYYSLAYAVESPEGISKEAWGAVRIAAGVLLAALSFLLVRSSASLVIVGALVFAATLFLGWWGTFAYLAAVAPVLCWHLDDWLGFGEQRVVWPGDPVRVVTTSIDERFPVRRPFPAVMDPSSELR